jgi:hypothetical protein
MKNMMKSNEACLAFKPIGEGHGHQCVLFRAHFEEHICSCGMKWSKTYPKWEAARERGAGGAFTAIKRL